MQSLQHVHIVNLLHRPGRNCGMTALAPGELARAIEWVRQGKPDLAIIMLERLAAAQGGDGDVQHWLGVAYGAMGDMERAEHAFHAALRVDAQRVATHIALAALLARTGRPRLAEARYRAALKLDRRSAAAAAALSDLLVDQDRAQDALKVTESLIALGRPDHAVLAARATALKAAGRWKAALAIHRRSAQLYPASAVADHNLASTLGDLGRFAESAASAVRALGKGLDAPQTWLVLGRARLGEGDLDGAETALREALRRQPDYVDAHRDLAQLIWMRSGDVELATQALNRALNAFPSRPEFVGLKATALEFAGDLAGAYATVRAALTPDPSIVPLLIRAAHLASAAGRPADGLLHAEAAISIAPDQRDAQIALCELLLAVGAAERAEAIAEGLLRTRPFDQAVLAYKATAWRLLGDARYGALYDYNRLTRAFQLRAPKGWSNLESYLADLAATLHGLHRFRTHPFDQSLRLGSQISHLTASEHPAIRAFFEAADAAIRGYIQGLGRGSDPVRSRNKGGYHAHSAWSVRLRPNGFHADHVHPEGWLSSAFYVDLPQTMANAVGREGWLKFGQPGVRTEPALGAEHFIEPEPGLLTLFPSYMWHGTVPFSGDRPRLAVAVDILPGPSQ
jgi:tetratricopeptide (TPR) repeat protein